MKGGRCGGDPWEVSAQRTAATRQRAPRQGVSDEHRFAPEHLPSPAAKDRSAEDPRRQKRQHVAPPGGPPSSERHVARRPPPNQGLERRVAGGRRWCSIRRCSCCVLNPDSFSSSSRGTAPGNACQSSRSGRSDASSATVRSKRSRACSARSRASSLARRSSLSLEMRLRLVSRTACACASIASSTEPEISLITRRYSTHRQAFRRHIM